MRALSGQFDAEAADSLSAIYAEIPALRCLGKCQAACGPIMMAPVEERQFEARDAVVPRALEMLRSGSLTCPHLGAFGHCTVYDIRPLICRLSGAAEGLSCEFGCRPERVLSKIEVLGLLERIDRLS